MLPNSGDGNLIVVLARWGTQFRGKSGESQSGACCRTMRKNWLGRTGLEISEIAFGGGVTGGILIKADERTRISALMRIAAAGINLIDTAPLYGGGASEEAIGRHLAALEPRPHISTKVRIEREDLMDIRGAIERSLEQSLKRLRTDSVAVFQLHNQLGTAIGDRPQLSVHQV